MCLGFSEVPQCISGRLVCAVTHFTMVVILAAYSASLVSYLAFRQPVLPFSTFSELLNDSTYQLGVHAASYIGKFDMVRVTIQSLGGTTKFPFRNFYKFKYHELLIF